jgi:hypothetical protein
VSRRAVPQPTRTLNVSEIELDKGKIDNGAPLLSSEMQNDRRNGEKSAHCRPGEAEGDKECPKDDRGVAR